MRQARRSTARSGPLVAALLASFALFAPAAAHADAPASPANPSSSASSEIAVEVVPIFGSGSAITWGWNEVLVRIQNSGTKAVRGKVEISAQQFSAEARTFTASAPFNVGAGSAVHVRVPTQVALFSTITVDVNDEAGAPIASTHLSATQPNGVLLVEISETSRIRGALNEMPVAPLWTAPSGGGRGAAPPTLTVTTPRFDPTTGDPLLPDRAALYSSADALVIRSDVLTRLEGAELEALAGYALSGGTMAIVVARPEDIRHPTLTAFAGGPIAKAGVSSVTLRELSLPPGSSSFGAPGKSIPPARNPSSEVSEALVGYAGGNLHGSPYGSSAFYGLGEVHLLAFDPTRKATASDPWAQIRLVDLARRAFDRRSSQVFRPGSEPAMTNYGRVRQQLDPNQSSRWAIGVAALLLCVYAALAGPVNFSLAGRKGRPLLALRRLPIFAAVTFAIVVGIGVGAKGVTGRARHLTLIEAGAGMSKGSARRFRGFFASRAKDLTVRTTDGSSVVSTAILAESADRKDHLIVDRDGARLVDVAALPWQTVVVREDGFGALGEGIAIVREGDSGATVVNRSGRDLRAALLRLPDGSMFYVPRLKDGEKLSSSSATAVSAVPDGSFWQSQVSSTSYHPGAITIHHLVASAMRGMLEQDAPGLSDAWWALEDAAGDVVDWFPDGAPVLLAQIDGGEGRTSDAGLRLESDRLLVRVVGFGGEF